MKTKRHWKNWQEKFLQFGRPVDQLLASRKSAALTTVIVLLWPWVSAASGAVTNCTEDNLRAAMAGGGSVTFDCDGTITPAGTITITTDTTVDASGHLVTISGNNAVRVFQVCTNVQFSVANLTVADGLATNGAGLLNAGGTVEVTNCIFCGNTVQGAPGYPYSNTDGESVAGGAVANQGALHLVNCTFTNNTATGGSCGSADGGGGPGFDGGSGAGGAVWNSGLLWINGCTFAGNSATGGAGGEGSYGDPMPWPTDGYPGGAGGDGAGGALFKCGTARLINCTLVFNMGTGGAGGTGGSGYQPYPGGPTGLPGADGPPGLSVGGIDDASGQCYVTNCTTVFNSGTGIRTTGTNGAKLINTLLAENSPGGNGSGAITDLGHNLSSDVTCAFTNAGSMNNTYPLLVPLSDNGGLTLTVALLPGCRAIDAGDTAAAPPTDQRGIARPFGNAADIGAYEYNEPTNPGPSTVVTECTEAGLRAAMSGGGHVTFACDGTVMLSNTVVITANTFLDGAEHQITIQGGGVRLFQISSNVTFSVANLVVAGGSAIDGAGIQNAGGFVNATNCVFSGNIATRGGAIQNEAGEVYLSACVFTNNRALGTPGAIWPSDVSGWGGALHNSGTLTVDLCIFVANSALGTDGRPGDYYGYGGGSGGDAAGGAIYNLSTLIVSRSTFTSNCVVAGRGADGYIGYHGDAGANGGPGGGGGGGGRGEGGALYNAGVTTVIGSTFTSNLGAGGNGGAGGAGGPAYGWGQGGTGGDGGQGGAGVGALYNSSDIQIVNSTFVFNSGSAGSGGQGGAGGSGYFGGVGGQGADGGAGVGAHFDDGESYSCWITNCTFAANSGTSGTGGSGGAPGYGDYQSGSPGAPGPPGSGAGGVRTTGGTMVNTLIASNLPFNCAGAIFDGGHNLSSDGSCAFTADGSRNNTDPMLGPLADNGGPTLTMALLPGSPAIDAGDNEAAPPADQRGFPRPVGPATDIGAYELCYIPVLQIGSPQTGTISILVYGLPNQSCRLLASDTLTNWLPIATNQISPNGMALFEDNSSITQTCRFYRVVTP